jgi:hypothetical protein
VIVVGFNMVDGGGSNDMNMNMNGGFASSKKSQKTKPTATASSLKPLQKLTAEQKNQQETKFIQDIFAAKSPYAQELKIPERFPTSTRNKQKDPFLRLELSNKHFNETPIAQRRKQQQQQQQQQHSAIGRGGANSSSNSMGFGDSSIDTSYSAAFIPATLPIPARSHSPPRAGTAANTATATATATATGAGSLSGPSLSLSSATGHGRVTHSKAKATASSASATSLPSENKGAFFFPSLLSATLGGEVPVDTATGTDSGVAAAEEEEEEEVEREYRETGEGAHKKKKNKLLISHVPDIDVVGSQAVVPAEMDDFSFLKSILL